MLPILQTQNQDMSLMQTRWASIIDPFLKRPSNQCLILKDVSLAVGSNVINHRLGRKLQGWRLVRKRAAAEIYDEQDDNQMPELTLILNSDSVVSIDLEVF